jgi:hypothetical protein
MFLVTFTPLGVDQCLRTELSQWQQASTAGQSMCHAAASIHHCHEQQQHHYL